MGTCCTQTSGDPYSTGREDLKNKGINKNKGKLPEGVMKSGPNDGKINKHESSGTDTPMQ